MHSSFAWWSNSLEPLLFASSQAFCLPSSYLLLTRAISKPTPPPPSPLNVIHDPCNLHQWPQSLISGEHGAVLCDASSPLPPPPFWSAAEGLILNSAAQCVRVCVCVCVCVSNSLRYISFLILISNHRMVPEKKTNKQKTNKREAIISLWKDDRE